MINVMAAGVLIYGALYLTGLFVAGLAFDRPDVAIVALAATGMSYLAQMRGTANAVTPSRFGAIVANVAWSAAIVLAAAGGAALLF